jgi:hypothetical protein
VKALDCQMRYESSWADLTKSVPRPSVALPLCTHRGCRLRTDRMRGICVWRDAHSAPSRALPAPGQMLAAERKQGPAPCCWIRLQGEACCAGFGAAESSEFS